MSVINSVSQKSFFITEAESQTFLDNPLLQRVHDAKEASIEKMQKDRFGWHHAAGASWRDWVRIGGDVTTGLSVLTSAMAKTSHKVSSSSAVQFLGTGFGIASGALNIAGGIVTLWSAYRSFAASDYKKGVQSVLSGVCYIFLGALMLVSSIAPHSPIAHLFKKDPWLLPLLFAASSIPLIIQTGHRVGMAALGKDLGSQILEALKHENSKKRALQILDKIVMDRKGLVSEEDQKAFRQKETDYFISLIQTAEADMGPEAALALFGWLKGTTKKETLEKEIISWHRVQKVRFAQRVAYIAAFVLGMGALSSSSAAYPLTSDLLMFGGNAIAFGLDTWYPLVCNSPDVPDPVTENL